MKPLIHLIIRLVISFLSQLTTAGGLPLMSECGRWKLQKVIYFGLPLPPNRFTEREW